MRPSGDPWAHNRPNTRNVELSFGVMVTGKYQSRHWALLGDRSATTAGVTPAAEAPAAPGRPGASPRPTSASATKRRTARPYRTTSRNSTGTPSGSAT